MNLGSNVKISQAVATTAANTTEVNGAELDMQNYRGVLFIVKFGTAAANNTISAQGTDTTTSYSADLAASLVSPASASDEIVWLDVSNPLLRYIRCQVQRGTSTTIDWGVALQYGPRKGAVDNTTSGTIYGEVLVSPADGTA